MRNRSFALQIAVAAAILVQSTAIMVRAQAKPDLRVVELSADKVQSENVPLRIKVTVEIKNFGATTPSGFTTRVSYKTTSSAPYKTLNDFHSAVRQTNGGDRWEKTFDFQEGGTYFFKADVDPDKQISESVEANNMRTLVKSFVGGTPDLAVKNLAAKFVSVSTASSHVRIDWDVENIGDGKVSGSFVTVLKVSKDGSNFAELARFTRTTLDKGKSFHYFKDVTYASVRSLRFMVVADATNAIHERSQNNNTAYSETIKP